MKIYKLLLDINNIQTLIPKWDVSADFFNMFDGRSLSKQWKKVEVISEDNSEMKKDVYGFKIPILDGRARNVLEPILQGDAELLPFEYDGHCLYGLNTTAVIDALDRERSIFKTFSDKKRIMLINEYAFNESMIAGRNIFKITDERTRYAFVSEAFAKVVKDNNLKGFDLKLVYESGDSGKLESLTEKENIIKKQEERHCVKIYTDKEAKLYEKYISKKIGKVGEVFHEIVSQDIHLDVIVISPSKNRPYYQLITMGAGAIKQSVPKGYKGDFKGYAEYSICLPANWNVHSNRQEDYWPIQMLKKIARLPFEEESWLAKGHTVSWDNNGASFDESTELNALIVLNKSDDNRKPLSVKLSKNKIITIFELYLLYQEELDFITSEGWANYVNRVPDEDLLYYSIIRPDRKNYCK